MLMATTIVVSTPMTSTTKTVVIRTKETMHMPMPTTVLVWLLRCMGTSLAAA
jgi:hypothetical protein